MKKTSWIIIPILLIGLTHVVNIGYYSNDKLHYFEEYLYFIKQTVKENKIASHIIVLNIGDEELDSLQVYFSKFTPGILTFLNFPFMQNSDQQPNKIGIYEDMDRIKYTHFGNLFINGKNSILKMINPRNETNENIFIDYFGQVDSFQLLYFEDIKELPNIISKNSSEIIIVGFAGRSFYPSLDGDTTEAWNTPKGIMYDTILKANIIAQFSEGILIRKLSKFELYCFSYIILFSLLISIRFINPNFKWLYWRFKAIQCIYLISILSLQLIYSNLIFPIGLSLIIIIVIGEISFWYYKKSLNN